MNSNRTIAFHTLGCKLNFAETSAIGRQLTEAGYRKVGFDENPDVFLINTCSVTENADRECRSIVNKALAINPDAIIAVTGCFAQLKPELIAGIPGVDLVLGASEKFNAPKYLDDLHVKSVPLIKACDINDVHEFNSSWSTGDRTRVFLKVQDGCDYSCTFCTIPAARGNSRSNSIQNVLHELDELERAGAREVVLTGINLGDYGIFDSRLGVRESSFTELAQLIEQNNSPERIRISSIEPNLLEPELISLVANSSKFVPHFHIPLQSGSDTILRKMRRRYLTALYAERISTIKSLIPDCCIGVDVITGFPGESETEFLETYNFLNQLNVSYLHVFTYSERDNTLAESMQDVVPMAIRKERTKMLRILSAKKLRAFYEQNLGTERKVLFEADNKQGWMHGFTENYVKVRTAYNPELINRIIVCTLDSIDESGDVNVTQNENVFAV
ncbi:MAG: tRNA (N(6)-L-threonylcarbamoyladenosine(37)-C(2))-methylthiotransferase MtaB [Bacteroidetes bacterium]|nr:tRNA (N(6)-L-threonylcarbamoyladenosine(37)-C(2))-methylthiotransferase MtaB [Bacteroidota bacterium]